MTISTTWLPGYFGETARKVAKRKAKNDTALAKARKKKKKKKKKPGY